MDVTSIVFAIAIVGAALVCAVWDSFRRALNAQVAIYVARLESQKRADYAALEARVTTLASDLNSLDQSIALGRRGR